MPAKRIEMRKIREVVRLHAAGISQREIGRVTGVSASTVGDLLGRVVVAGLTWPLSEDIDDEQLETLLYPSNPSGRGKIIPPDWSYIHRELRRKHMTLMLLWQEYKVAHPEDGYQYSHFCEKYQREVSALCEESGRIDAPGARGRREGVCGLVRRRHNDNGPCDRQG